MGVDLNVTIGVGIAFKEADLTDEWKISVDHDEYGTYEAMDGWIHNEYLNRGVRFGQAGSYWTDRSDELWNYVAINRLTEGYDGHSIKGGLYGVTRPVLRLDELNLLSEISYRLTGKNIVPTQFVGVLWS
jgi:hypothetical protein